MTLSYPFIAIPGFLGLSADWSQFPFANMNHFDLYKYAERPSLNDFGESLNARAASFNQPIALGYSLGGRIALHALSLRPDLWSAAIIISTHPGLKTNEERQKRKLEDQGWALRFQQEPWDLLINSWDGRAVFGSQKNVFCRIEQDYDRHLLSQLLINSSLAFQEDLRDSISLLPFPILWLVGASDEKFRLLSEELQFFNPLSEVLVIPEAGHRAPWEQPNLFYARVQKFLRNAGLGSG